jgi:choline kinase
MKCILLAAGASTRLHPLTLTTPKCLLPMGNTAIIDRMLRSISTAGIEEIIIVTGFESGQIRNHVETEFSSLSITWIENSRYRSTNNAVSLFCARNNVDGEAFVLLDSDIVFDTEILSLVIRSQSENAAAIRTTGRVGDEDIKVMIDENWNIIKIGKDIDPGEAKGESIGIEKFSPRSSRQLFSILERRITKENRVNEFYEASFQELIDNGTILRGVDTGRLRSIEIDTENDLLEARTIFTSLSLHPQ